MISRVISSALAFGIPFLRTFSLREKKQAFCSFNNSINAAPEAYHGRTDLERIKPKKFRGFGCKKNLSRRFS